MTLPEEKLVRRHLQILGDEDRMKAATESLEGEIRSTEGPVIKLSKLVIERVTGRK